MSDPAKLEGAPAAPVTVTHSLRIEQYRYRTVSSPVASRTDQEEASLLLRHQRVRHVVWACSGWRASALTRFTPQHSSRHDVLSATLDRSFSFDTLLRSSIDTSILDAPPNASILPPRLDTHPALLFQSTSRSLHNPSDTTVLPSQNPPTTHPTAAP